MTPPWGWTPPGGSAAITPPRRLFLREGDGLQAAVDSLIGGAGEIWLDSGTFYGDPLSPTTTLTIPGTVNVIIRGVNYNDTLIRSPVWCQSIACGFESIWFRPPAGAFGLKIRSLLGLAGEFLARNWIDNCFIGASANGAGDGPVLGLVLDGAGVFLAERLTCAFCTSHGMIADSTGVEPNTTLKFDMCSFVQNGGYGAKLMQSMLQAEFNGGNMEGNVTGEFYAEETNVLRMLGVDFETSQVMGNQFEISNTKNIEIRGNNFLTASGKATRAIICSGSHYIDMVNNRFEGYGAVGVARIGESCTHVVAEPNQIVSGGGWIEDYSR